METKFTKTEWKANDEGIVYCFDKIVCDTYMIGEDDLANARLIAAAPEMYADIEEDIEELSHELNNKNLTPHARAHLTNKLNIKTKLLAKARGEQ